MNMDLAVILPCLLYIIAATLGWSLLYRRYYQSAAMKETTFKKVLAMSHLLALLLYAAYYTAAVYFYQEATRLKTLDGYVSVAMLHVYSFTAIFSVGSFLIGLWITVRQLPDDA